MFGGVAEEGPLADRGKAFRVRNDANTGPAVLL